MLIKFFTYQGDYVVVTSGFLEGVSGATNMFQVRQVE